MNKRRWTIILCILCAIFCRSMMLQASVEKQRITLNMQGMTYKNNGGTTDLNSGKDGEWSVKYDTTGEKKGYYTTYLYVKQKETIGSGSVISFNMSTKKKVRMNADIVHEPNNQYYKCPDGSPVFLKGEGNEQYEAVSVEYGTFEIPENFSGMVYLPIQDKGKEFHTYGIGFVVVLSENEKADFTIKSVEISKGYELQDDIFYSDIAYKGQNTIQIPVHGQYFYNYHVSKDRKKVKQARFYLEKDIEGIQMEHDGKLVIDDRAKPQEISILVEIDQVLQYKFSVILIRSWIKKTKNLDVSSFEIPDVTEVEHADGKIAIPYQFLRIVLLILGAAFLIFYVVQIKMERRN